MNSKFQQIGLDDGSGNFGLSVDVEGERLEMVIPSILQNRPAVRTFAGAGVVVAEYKTKGQVFSTTPAGDHALTTTTKDYQTSDANRVLAYHALSQIPTDKPIIMACTLPAEQFYLDGESLQEDSDRIREKAANMLVPVENTTPGAYAPHIAHVEVFPEALPAYVSEFFDDEGNPRSDDISGRYLIADLGRYSLDMAIIKDGSVPKAKTVYDCGVEDLCKELRRILAVRQSQYDIKFDPMTFTRDELDSFIDSRTLGASMDISDEVEEAAGTIVKAILAHINEFEPNWKLSCKGVLFVGGGANWLGEAAKAKWSAPNLIIPERPELAIARGLRILLTARADELAAIAEEKLKAAKAATPITEEEVTE